MSNKASSSGGIGFFGLLTIVFIVLKLINVISWSWWLVLLPAYGSVGIMLLIILALVVYNKQIFQ